MIMWRKGKGGAGMPLQIGYLGKLPVFHIFWNCVSDEKKQYKLDIALCYTKGPYFSPSIERSKEQAIHVLEQWLTATGLKEDDE